MRGVTLGFLVALAGCYAPSYVDCAITCPDGATCPSGYVCEPSLKVCRPEGASGSCPGGGGGDASRDSVTIEDDAGPPVFGAYCASRGTPSPFLYCQDFDSGASLQEQGWDVAQMLQGTATLAIPGVSPMNRFEARTPNDQAEAQIRDTFMVPQATYTTLSIYFQMQELERTSGAPKTVFALRVGSEIQIDLYSTGPGTLTAQLNGVTVTNDFAPVQGAWARYELRFVAGGGGSGDAGTGQLTASMYIENNSNPISMLGTVTRPSLTTAWEMWFGLAAGNGNNGVIRFGYDNIEVYY